MPELTIEEQLARYGAAAEVQALDASVIELHSLAPDASADRRWIPSVAALLIVLALGTAVVAIATERPTPVATDPDPAPTGPTTYVDDLFGWSVEVPGSWHVRYFESTCWRGVAVVNTEREFEVFDSSGCSESLEVLSRSPADVAVVLYELSAPVRGGLHWPRDLADTDTVFPIVLPSDAAGLIRTWVVLDGVVTDLRVGQWNGPEASVEDRTTAQAVVASLRPPAALVAQEHLAPVEIEWWDARIEGTSGLVLSFIGGRPDTDPMGACQVSYRAEVVETDDDVTIRIHGEQLFEPGVGCTDEGYSRTTSVGLGAALGDRTVRNLRGEAIEVWAHSTLRAPTWLPGGFGGWSLTSEWRYETGVLPRHNAWGRTWTSAVGHLVDDRCDGSDTWTIRISQGPPEAVFPGPNQMRPEGIGERSIRGVNAIEGIADSAALGLMSRSLWWQEGEVAFMISAGRPCDAGEPPSFDDLARIAESLE